MRRIACCLFWLPLAAAAEPRLEAGMALGALSYPDWRGATHRNLSVLPLPYAIYRGDRLRLSRDGLRARLFADDNLTLSLAAGFALAGDAKNNPARAGMEPILNSFSVGPVVNYALPHKAADRLHWDLRLPLYAVGATNFRRFERVGFSSYPHLRVRSEWPQGARTLRAGATLGVHLADEHYHDYFYQVSPSQVRAERPAFDAQAGFGGLGSTAYLGASQGPWAAAVFLRADSLQGARFENSPLVQRKDYLSLGLGLSYRFYASRQTTAADDSE